MRLTRSTVRRAALTFAAAGLAVGLQLASSPAVAAPGLSLDGAATLTAQLGSRTAGTYLDQATGRLVVTVTDAAAADAVRASGGVARVVSRSAAELNGITGALYHSARITGTAWAVDTMSNQVVISVDSSVDKASRARIDAVAKAYGAAVRIEDVAGIFTLAISGGQAITTGGSRCSLGFNVRSGSGQQYFLTAGHCTNIGSTWSGGGVVLGTRAASSFPGNDYGVVRYTNTSVAKPGNVWLYSGSSTQDITGARNAVVNETVRRSGSTTGVHSGRVTATNATVNYPQGTVTGLIRTTVCAQPGDSGGSLFAGSSALGLTSGGSGNCTTGGTTFFQPVTEPLNRYGLSVY